MQSRRLLEALHSRMSGFNQRVWLGIAGIISMLLLSGASALLTLHDIEYSRSRTSTIAVPVLTIANEAQIRLLKLARLSANAFSEQDDSALTRYSDRITHNSGLFEQDQRRLEEATREGEALQLRVAAVGAAYDEYNRQTLDMLEAKKATVTAEQQVLTQARELKSALDNLGQAYVDIQNFRPPVQYRENALDASVALSGVDIYLSSLSRLVDEAILSSRAEELEGFMDQATGDLLSTSMLFESSVVPEIEMMDTAKLIETAREASRTVAGKIRDSQGFVTSKLHHIAQQDRATQAMTRANMAMSTAINELDSLIDDAKTTFGTLETGLARSLVLGTTKIGVFTLALTIAASMVFMSMLRAIRRRINDLETLNHIADILAETRSREEALHHVMEALSAKTGVNSGSVFMINTCGVLEFACAYPRKRGSTETPRPFVIGEGIMGSVALEKKARFVADTSLDPRHVDSDNHQPRALLSVPLTDRDTLIGVMNLTGNIQDVHFSEGDHPFVSTVAHSLVTTLKNLSMIDVIEVQNRTLEEKVASRTAQLLDAQQKLVESEKMAALGVFTAGMAHEINNPANFVSVGIQNADAQLESLEAFIMSLLDDSATDEDIDPFKAHFSRIRESHLTVRDGARRIESVISKMRTSHPEGNTGKTDTDIVELLESAWSMVHPTITRPVSVERHFESHPAVFCAVRDMHQVFIALLSNAGHALEDMTISRGGQQPAVLILRVRTCDAHVLIDVEDNGVGISEETMSKIFDPFFTTKEVGRGAGLGLSMARQVIQDHGGHITVSSSINEGTRFTVALRMAP